MYYVTEDELRERYNQEHFSELELPEDARLTPSARQFLIDFHVAFEKEPEAKTASLTSTSSSTAPAPSKGVTPGEAQALYDAMRSFGARLRLLGRLALGVNNSLAAQCDRFGTAWAQVSISELDALSADKSCTQEAFPLLPACSGEVHPFYFELAVMDAELAQEAHALIGHEFEGSAQEAAASWFISINVVRALFAEALLGLQSEVSHG